LSHIDRVTWDGPTGNKHHAVKFEDSWRLAGDARVRLFSEVVLLTDSGSNVEFHEGTLTPE